MDNAEAIDKLESSNAHIRLKASRHLASYSQPEDEEALRRALKQESVSWIIKALSEAIANISSEGDKGALRQPFVDDEDNLYDQAHAIVVEDTTRMLLHEVEPVVGAIRIAVRSEIEDHESSQTWEQLDRLESLLHAISRLSKSASSPRLKEFDLSEMIERIVDQEAKSTKIGIETVGREHQIVTGDPEMVEMVICNGLRNAIEAMEAMGKENEESIVLTWGDTDLDYWIAILDRGPGLPIGSHRVWDIGSSTKKGHLGMGLPIAKQAARSLGGDITLVPRSESGSRFEFRWLAMVRS